LYTRSQLFMTMLKGKSCCALVAQALPCVILQVFSLSSFQREPF
jgi:hypothetical protein